MNPTSLRALTWGTVAAAVISALLLAVAEVGGMDFDLESVSETLHRTSLPSDLGDAESRHTPPSGTSRDSSPGRDTSQR